MELGSIFLGNTPSEQRKFLCEALDFLRVKGFSRLVIPCCGQFAVAKAAIQAGWKPEQIETSDISLFSSVVGYLAAGIPIATLDISIVDDKDQEFYDAQENDVKKGAFILYLIKLCQLRTDVNYEKMYFDELIERKDFYLSQIESKIKDFVSVMGGINYKIADLRDYFNKGKKTDVFVINPPAFKKGYEKMFRHDDRVVFNVNVEEFDFNAEYAELYERSQQSNAIYLWYRYKEVQDFPAEEVMFGKEYTFQRTDYWLCTKPNILIEMPTAKVLSRKKNVIPHGIHAPMFDDTCEITPTSKVHFQVVQKEVSFYYRDLWAHKLGMTNCEVAMMIYIDGKIAGTVGWHTADMRLLRSDKIFETYCFNVPSKRYKRLNRLLMMYLTCEEMQDILMHTVFMTNRTYECHGVKTTCLSGYRKVKLNNGILKVMVSEKLPNGLYRILYETPWHKRRFQDCTQLFLKEEENGKTA